MIQNIIYFMKNGKMENLSLYCDYVFQNLNFFIEKICFENLIDSFEIFKVLCNF